MKKATGTGQEANRLRILQESCIRTNTAILSEAAWTMGKVEIGIKAVANDGRCTIRWPITLNGEQAPSDTDWPEVTWRMLTDAGQVETVITALPKALSNLARETIEFAQPRWRDSFEIQRFNLLVKEDTAFLDWTQGNGRDPESGNMSFEPHTSDLFMKKAPVVETGSGAWYEIAGLLSRTAVGHFYQQRRSETGQGSMLQDPARWFIHLDLDGDVPVAGIALAAQPAEGFDASVWPHFSHVTGLHNADIFLERESDIRALAAAAGLIIEPNWMGKPLALAPAEPAVNEVEPAGRILRTQIDQGWTTGTLEMLSRRFIEVNGLSAEYASYLEEQAMFENSAEPEGEDGPGL